MHNRKRNGIHVFIAGLLISSSVQALEGGMPVEIKTLEDNDILIIRPDWYATGRSNEVIRGERIEAYVPELSLVKRQWQKGPNYWLPKESNPQTWIVNSQGEKIARSSHALPKKGESAAQDTSIRMSGKQLKEAYFRLVRIRANTESTTKETVDLVVTLIGKTKSFKEYPLGTDYFDVCELLRELRNFHGDASKGSRVARYSPRGSMGLGSFSAEFIHVPASSDVPTGYAAPSSVSPEHNEGVISAK